MTAEPDAYCVYRVHDPDTRALLYVGCTCKRHRRMKQHRERSDWFSWYVWEAEITYEEHPDYWSAMIAEAEAIRDEHPRYNKERPDPDQLRALRDAEQAS